MNVIGFVARVTCEACGGKGRVPGGQTEYGELVSCVSCHGRGSRDYEMPLQDFVSMIQEFLYLMPPIAPPTTSKETK